MVLQSSFRQTASHSQHASFSRYVSKLSTVDALPLVMSAANLKRLSLALPRTCRTATRAVTDVPSSSSSLVYVRMAGQAISRPR